MRGELIKEVQGTLRGGKRGGEQGELGGREKRINRKRRNS